MTSLSTILRRTCRPIHDNDRFSLTPAGLAALDAANKQLGNEQICNAAETGKALDQAIEAGTDRPRPEWTRGVCPDCGGVVVANSYYIGGRGFLVVHECWNSLPAEPTCTYRKVL